MPHNKRKNKNKNKHHAKPQQQQQKHHTPVAEHEQRAADPVNNHEIEQQQHAKVEQSMMEVSPETQLEHEEKAGRPQESEMTPTETETQNEEADNQLDHLEAQDDDAPMDSLSLEQAPPAETSSAPNDSPMADDDEQAQCAASDQATRESPQQTIDDTEHEPTPEQQPHDEHHDERQQELAKLRAIEGKVQVIRDKLTSRLPLQRSHLAARVCGAIWAARTRLAKLARESSSDVSDHQHEQLYSQLAKKLRMELGAFDYQTKEQGELLTRLLCDLDDILSFGDAEVKRVRKALVVAIQSDALPLADALRDQSARLRAFGEMLLATLPQSASLSGPTAASKASDAKQQTDASARQSDSDNQTMDAPQDTADTNSDMDDDDELRDELARHQTCATAATPASPPRQRLNHHHAQHQHAQQSQPHAHAHPAQRQQPQQQRPPKPADDVLKLPVWRPYYQLQKRRDGLYLVANLRGVEPSNVHVQWLASVGVLRISGHKLPTQKDLAVMRFSGVPTFGRFEIAERLPADALAMDSATQALRPDGTLEIRMPYAYVRPPPQSNPFARRSLFNAPRPFFW